MKLTDIKALNGDIISTISNNSWILEKQMFNCTLKAIKKSRFLYM